MNKFRVACGCHQTKIDVGDNFFFFFYVVPTETGEIVIFHNWIFLPTAMAIWNHTMTQLVGTARNHVKSDKESVGLGFNENFIRFDCIACDAFWTVAWKRFSSRRHFFTALHKNCQWIIFFLFFCSDAMIKIVIDFWVQNMNKQRATECMMGELISKVLEKGHRTDMHNVPATTPQSKILAAAFLSSFFFSFFSFCIKSSRSDR